ncbi:19624_t:CDS:2 [Cetraspora pellucida]|uniref:19624_t:CDS:1 n=1 Tax=Cetraspora pellucida TaxID=1433469 RepID=A0A9N9AQN6_9GLOM|nr:19624_t:CDS:2 [Cetraspora pellucida]
MDKNTGDFILVMSYTKFGLLHENMKGIFKLEWSDIVYDLSHIIQRNLCTEIYIQGNDLSRK